MLKKIIWRLKFLLLESWGKNLYVVLYTVFPFIRAGKDGRIHILEKQGLLTWNEEKHFISFNTLTIHYGDKAPISDIISIFFYHHPFVQKNFIKNSAFPFEGPYEEAGAALKEGDVVIDAGANIGIFSLFASQKVGTEGQVIAFEPIQETRVLLEKNISSHPIRNIKASHFALGEKTGTTTFSKDTGLLGSSGIFSKGENSEEVMEITLDEYVQINGIKKVDFIKADIEGMERSLLKGAEKTIREHKPKVAICIYHLPDDPEVILGLLKSFVPEYKFFKTDTKLFAYL